jgi:hypothetical protein
MEVIREKLSEREKEREGVGSRMALGVARWLECVSESEREREGRGDRKIPSH